jgi:hypothetical protein
LLEKEGLEESELCQDWHVNKEGLWEDPPGDEESRGRWLSDNRISDIELFNGYSDADVQELGVVFVST